MTILQILILILAAVLGLIAALIVRKRLRRSQALAQPFLEQWKVVLRQNVPVYGRLSPAEQQQLRSLIQQFLYDKSFEGCGGLELTDEIRVTIAGQACLLLLNRPVSCYPKLSSVLVYPSTYVARDPNGDESVRLGESWQTGAVVLAWDSARRGAANFADGRNVVLHEFAHQLDQEDGSGDGAPILGSASSYAPWAQVFSKEFVRHCERVARGKKTVLDDYGATNPAEFFAVATETFFEKPRQLSTHHYTLYAELRAFYRVDPLNWT